MSQLPIGPRSPVAKRTRDASAAQNETDPSFDDQFAGQAPGKKGAKSAVTGGHPEDMNGMPATGDPEKEGPVYDGADLKE